MAKNNIYFKKSKYLFPGTISSGAIKERINPNIIPVKENNNANRGYKVIILLHLSNFSRIAPSRFF